MKRLGLMGGYVLGGPDGKTPVPVGAADAAEFFGGDYRRRRVALTTIPGGYVSTVFLVYDHNFTGCGGPVLFETRVFGGPLDDATVRYQTFDEAAAGHAGIVADVRAKYNWWGWHWGRLRRQVYGAGRLVVSLPGRLAAWLTAREHDR